MFNFESQYLWILLKFVVKTFFAKLFGGFDTNRTGVKTVTLWGQTLRVKVRPNALPVLVTKSIHLHSVITELVWFLNGDSNIRFLLQNGVNIWTANAYQHNKKKPGFPRIDLAGYTTQSIPIGDYARRIVADSKFAEEFGGLGDVYGASWRNFNGTDQILKALDLLHTNSDTRQNLVMAWNPATVDQAALPPCHFAFQLLVKNGRLNIVMYQRSADWFLGVPFNITSYSVLLLLLAQTSGYKPGELIIQFGDAHLYENHLKPALVQLSRWPFKIFKRLPKIRIASQTISLRQKIVDPSAFEVTGYRPMSRIKADMAV